jgi:hypothetical protein
MQASFCPGCGAPVVAGAQFCSYCGTPIPGGTPPLASSGGPVSSSFPPPGPAASYGQPPPPTHRRHTWVILAVVLVVIILIGAVAAVDYFEVKPPPIQVGFIVVYAPDNVCGLNANPIAFYGFNSSTSAAQALDFGMPNYNASACTIHGASTNTTGFSLSAIQVPVSIPGNGTGSMNITITPPKSPYSGNMNLILV